MRLYSQYIDLLEYSRPKISPNLKILVAFGLGLRGFIYDDVIFDYQKMIFELLSCDAGSLTLFDGQKLHRLCLLEGYQ